MLALPLVLALETTPPVTAEPRRATIVTTKGEAVEGAFTGASAKAVTLEVAGQTVTIPIESIGQIYFVRKPETALEPTLGTIEGAFAAFDKIALAIRIGVLRGQYAERLLATLPAVIAFLDTPGSDWSDVKEIVRAAVEAYRGPLEGPTAWPRAHAFFATGRMYVTFAATLAANPGERTHQERAAIRELPLGEEVVGRLGHGDYTIPAALDLTSTDRYADVFAFHVGHEDGERQLLVAASGAPCAMRAILENEEGVNVADSGRLATVAIPERSLTFRRRLRGPGAYKLWLASHSGPCLYTATAVIRDATP